jgi:hypothetical protein
MRTYINENQNDNMQEFIKPLTLAVDDLVELSDYLLEKSTQNVNEIGAAANDYLHVFGYTAMAFVWAKMAAVALAKQATGDDFYESKLKTARYYFTRLLPRRISLIESAKSGCEVLFDIDDELF